MTEMAKRKPEPEEHQPAWCPECGKLPEMVSVKLYNDYELGPDGV